MYLSELANALPDAQRFGDDADITALAYDSRQALPGALFIALRGANSDGHDFIAQAVNNGAAALLIDADKAPWYGARGLPAVAVPDTRAAMPLVAATLYGFPSRELDLIGVTGTNGKTTTTYMIESILRTWGERVGLVGTLGALINGRPAPLERTTPEAPDLQRLFAEMGQAGVRRVVMEVSSQGILQKRTEQCAFDTGVFTNLTQDHLDAHGTMEAYFAEKQRLFVDYPDAFPDKPFNAVVNADDPYGQQLIAILQEAGRPILRYGLSQSDAPLRAEILEARPDGTRFEVQYQPPQGSLVRFVIDLRLG
ncbi:MAG: Mur ligase family protein, partial [Armatimonadota bacterium]|nr:Mur ligase family protein [Armatimonadota bacterium]